MARSIATGPSSRAAAVRAAKWCHGPCCIWARSTTVSARVGAAPSKRSIPCAIALYPWPSFRRTGPCPNTPRAWACRCIWTAWNCIGPANGAPAGWPANSTNNSGWVGSGPSACPTVGRALAGGTSCKRWSATGSWIRAANGACTGSGSSRARWAICSGAIMRWWRRMASIARWKDLFGAQFDVLLYDLTSTYFESVPPEDETDKRRFGHSRDKRPDCVQVVIGLIVTPEGFPLAYEVMPGNTADKTTLKAFLQKIETQYGKAQRIWVMDRGIPTEAVLEQMRQSQPPVFYLVGTPKGRLSQLEAQLLPLDWQAVRPGEIGRASCR